MGSVPGVSSSVSLLVSPRVPVRAVPAVSSGSLVAFGSFLGILFQVGIPPLKAVNKALDA